MAQFKHTSWGRTRSPKNILSSNRAGINSSGAAATVNAAAESSECLTENQRFLHITATAAGNGTLEIWGYMHATGVWALVEAGIATSSTRKHTIKEISGIDKVKIKAVAQNLTELWLACSTF
jgi:hypothetical protein